MTRHVPERTCIGCGRKGVKSALIRFVLTSDGEICLDLGQKMPGRGAYVCRDVMCFEKAWKKKAFVHALRVPVTKGLMAIDGDTYRKLRNEMENFTHRKRRDPEKEI